MLQARAGARGSVARLGSAPSTLVLAAPLVALVAAAILATRPTPAPLPGPGSDEPPVMESPSAGTGPIPLAPGGELGAPNAARRETITYAATAGESLAAIAARHGISDDDLVALIDSTPSAWRMLKLREGGTLTITRNGSRVQSLLIEADDGAVISFVRAEHGFEVSAATEGLRGFGRSPELAHTPAGAPAAPLERSAPDPLPAATSLEVAAGDSLYSIFKRLGLSAQLLARLVASGAEGKRLSRLRPGDLLEFRTGDDRGDLRSVVYRPTATLALEFTRTTEGDFSVTTHEREYRVEVASVTSTIRSSLFAAAAAADIPDRLTVKLVELFGWDIDFALDIRAGDSFTVVHEQRHLDDRYFGPGEILAAEFRNNSAVYRAVRYRDASGRVDYFTPEGDRLRRAFIRTPVRFARISSRFNPRRLHPVLHTLRAHRGVDYAAPPGTPVRAAGDGRVIWIGRKGGYGKTVILQHGGVYTTLYAHLSGYGKIQRRSHVSQGQTIGYVGSTGLATGPHLHYEFRVNGVHRNPLTVPLPRAEQLPDAERARFDTVIAPLLRQLDYATRTTLVQASSP